MNSDCVEFALGSAVYATWGNKIDTFFLKMNIAILRRGDRFPAIDKPRTIR